MYYNAVPAGRNVSAQSNGLSIEKVEKWSTGREPLPGVGRSSCMLSKAGPHPHRSVLDGFRHRRRGAALHRGRVLAGALVRVRRNEGSHEIAMAPETDCRIRLSKNYGMVLRLLRANQEELCNTVFDLVAITRRRVPSRAGNGD